MARNGYGWAYVGNIVTGSGGVSYHTPRGGSLQFKTGPHEISGSSRLLYFDQPGTATGGILALSGTLNVSGAINANELNIDQVNKTITNLSATGSTEFGDSLDDNHIFIGKIAINGTTTPSPPATKLHIDVADSENIGGIYVNFDETGNYKALEIDSESTSTNAATINGKFPLALTQDIADGYGLRVARALSENGSNPLVNFIDDHTSNTQTTLRVQQDGTGDILNLFDGATEVFTVLDGGNVGVGTTTPETSLHVQNGSAGTVAAVDNTVMILESSEKPRLQFQSPDAYGGTIVFGSPTDNDEGQIDYDHGSDRFLFKTGGSTKMTILGSNVGIGVTDPDTLLELFGTSTQLKLSYNADDYASFTVGSNGDLTIATVDAASHAADLTFTVDGAIKLDGDGVEIENDSDSGAAALFIDNSDVDAIALSINASNTTADIFDIQANSLTTAIGFDILSTSLTSGKLIHANDNSSDTSTRNVVEIKQNHSSATGATALKVQSDSAGPVAALHIDRNHDGTTSASTNGVKGIYVDLDQTGELGSGTGTVVGVDVELETNSASGGTINAFGHRITMTGDTDGTHSHTGISINLGQADNNTHVELLSSTDTGDKFTISTTTHGATTIETIDDDATAAHLTFTVDGDITMKPAGGNLLLNDGSNDVFDFDVTDPTFKIMDDADTGDYFSINVAANGSTTLTTVDDDATAANLRLSIDGDITMFPAGTNLYISGLNDSAAEYNVFEFDTATPTFKIADDSDNGDYFSISMAAHGATTFTTVDDDATAADLRFSIDGDITMYPVGANFYINGLNDSASEYNVFEFDTATPTFKIADDSDSGDFFSISMAANGATTITTVDDDATAADLTFTIDGDIILGPAGGDVLPDTDNSRNLGSPAKRWANLYTGDLHLKNDRGDWTILEEADYLCVINNKTGKKYKMDLTPLEDDE